MRGRKPIPEYIKRITGSSSKRPFAATIKPPSDEPEPPACLSAEALRIWHEMAGKLRAADVFNGFARAPLARYADALATWRAVAEAEARMGAARLKPTKATWRTLVHMRSVKKSCELTMQHFEEGWGLTPASSTRVSRPASPEVAAFNSFIATKPQPQDLRVVGEEESGS